MKVIKIIIVVILVWISLTTLVQAFKNTNLTQTELFLKIPQSFLLKF